MTFTTLWAALSSSAWSSSFFVVLSSRLLHWFRVRFLGVSARCYLLLDCSIRADGSASAGDVPASGAASRASFASFRSLSFVAAAPSFSSPLPTATAVFWSSRRLLFPLGRCRGRGRGCARARSARFEPRNKLAKE